MGLLGDGLHVFSHARWSVEESARHLQSVAANEDHHFFVIECTGPDLIEVRQVISNFGMQAVAV